MLEPAATGVPPGGIHGSTIQSRKAELGGKIQMRIAIVNDMLLAVEAMRRAVVSSSEHRVAWIARDGDQAVQLCRDDRPDLILMDLIMPTMDGVEATRRIMTATPCPILVVTAHMNENPAKVFEAMGAGALDAVTTPALGRPGDPDAASGLLTKIDSIRRLVGAGNRLGPSSAKTSESHSASKQLPLVAIGASAGGPAAVARVLAGLPADFRATLVVVQHVDVQFARGLVDWLASHTKLKVQLAQAGDAPQAGKVYLSGRDEHLVFAQPGRLGYVGAKPSDCFCPSVDVFFESAVRFWDGKLVGVLLTGMGRDGAVGLKSLRERGCHTIAQDAASAAVFGMPKAAAELGAAVEILALDRIAPRLRHLCPSSVAPP